MRTSVRFTRSARKRLQHRQHAAHPEDPGNPEPLDNPDPDASGRSGTSGTSGSPSEEVRLLHEFEAFQQGVSPTTKRRRVAEAERVDADAAPCTPSTGCPHAGSSRFTASSASTVSTSASGSLGPGSSGFRMPESGARSLGPENPEAPPDPDEPTTKVEPEKGRLPQVMRVPDEQALAGAPEGELYVVQVLARTEIMASSDVDAEVAMLQKVVQHKQQQDALSWAQEYAAIDSVRRLAIHHPDALAPLLETALSVLVYPAAGNLRSAMVRNALLCLQDVVLWQGQHMAQNFEQMVPLLLQRTAHEKQFIRDLAHKVMTTTVQECSGEVLLSRLLRISHEEKNAQIISSAGVYASKCIAKMDTATLKTFVHASATCVEDLSRFLSCRVVECKIATRRSLRVIRTALGDSTFTTLVRANLQGGAQHDVLCASEPKKLKNAKSSQPRISMRERMLQMKRQQAQQQQTQPATASTSTATASALSR